MAGQNPTDAYRSVQHGRQNLALIPCTQHRRKLSKNLCQQFTNREYQLHRGAEVTVGEGLDGTVTLLHKGHIMDYRLLPESDPPIPLGDEKNIPQRLEQAKLKHRSRPAKLND